MSEKIEAVVVLCKCGKNHKMYGIRAEKESRGYWNLTWAFPVKEEICKREKYDSNYISGGIIQSNEYPGCPYCKSRALTVCTCGRLNCSVQEGIFRCEWCGNSGEVVAYRGERIMAGGDI